MSLALRQLHLQRNIQRPSISTTLPTTLSNTQHTILAVNQVSVPFHPTNPLKNQVSAQCRRRPLALSRVSVPSNPTHPLQHQVLTRCPRSPLAVNPVLVLSLQNNLMKLQVSARCPLRPLELYQIHIRIQQDIQHTLPTTLPVIHFHIRRNIRDLSTRQNQHLDQLRSRRPGFLLRQQ